MNLLSQSISFQQLENEFSSQNMRITTSLEALVEKFKNSPTQLKPDAFYPKLMEEVKSCIDKECNKNMRTALEFLVQIQSPQNIEFEVKDILMSASTFFQSSQNRIFTDKLRKWMKEYFEQLEKDQKQEVEEEGFISSDSKESDQQGSFTPFGRNKFKKRNYHIKKQSQDIEDKDGKTYAFSSEVQSLLNQQEEEIKGLKEKVAKREDILSEVTYGYMKDVSHWKEIFSRKDRDFRNCFEVSYFEPTIIFDDKVREVLNNKLLDLKNQCEIKMSQVYKKVKLLTEELIKMQGQLQAFMSENDPVQTVKTLFTLESDPHKIWKILQDQMGNSYFFRVFEFQRPGFGIKYKEIDQLIASSKASAREYEEFKKNLKDQMDRMVERSRKEVESIRKETEEKEKEIEEIQKNFGSDLEKVRQETIKQMEVKFTARHKSMVYENKERNKLMESLGDNPKKVVQETLIKPAIEKWIFLTKLAKIQQSMENPTGEDFTQVTAFIIKSLKQLSTQLNHVQTIHSSLNESKRLSKKSSRGSLISRKFSVLSKKEGETIDDEIPINASVHKRHRSSMMSSKKLKRLGSASSQTKQTQATEAKNNQTKEILPQDTSKNGIQTEKKKGVDEEIKIELRNDQNQFVRKGEVDEEEDEVKNKKEIGRKVNSEDENSDEESEEEESEYDEDDDDEDEDDDDEDDDDDEEGDEDGDKQLKKKKSVKNTEEENNSSSQFKKSSSVIIEEEDQEVDPPVQSGLQENFELVNKQLVRIGLELQQQRDFNTSIKNENRELKLKIQMYKDSFQQIAISLHQDDLTIEDMVDKTGKKAKNMMKALKNTSQQDQVKLELELEMQQNNNQAIESIMGTKYVEKATMTKIHGLSEKLASLEKEQEKVENVISDLDANETAINENNKFSSNNDQVKVEMMDKEIQTDLVNQQEQFLNNNEKEQRQRQLNASQSERRTQEKMNSSGLGQEVERSSVLKGRNGNSFMLKRDPPHILTFKKKGGIEDTQTNNNLEKTPKSGGKNENGLEVENGNKNGSNSPKDGKIEVWNRLFKDQINRRKKEEELKLKIEQIEERHWEEILKILDLFSTKQFDVDAEIIKPFMPKYAPRKFSENNKDQQILNPQYGKRCVTPSLNQTKSKDGFHQESSSQYLGKTEGIVHHHGSFVKHLRHKTKTEESEKRQHSEPNQSRGATKKQPFEFFSELFAKQKGKKPNSENPPLIVGIMNSLQDQKLNLQNLMNNTGVSILEKSTLVRPSSSNKSNYFNREFKNKSFEGQQQYLPSGTKINSPGNPFYYYSKYSQFQGSKGIDINTGQKQ